MTAIYVPSKSTGCDTIAFQFNVASTSNLSAALCIPQHMANFPSSCVWMVPGTYEQED